MTIKATYYAHMGNDLTPVNAARVSFGKSSDFVRIDKIKAYPGMKLQGQQQNLVLSQADHSLIHFLARGCTSREWDNTLDTLTGSTDREEAERILKWAKNMPTHWTPFSHPHITIVEQVPIFVARQRFKHMVGFTYNEVSRRYVDDEPEFYVPSEWRSRPQGSVKQGSDGKHPDNDEIKKSYDTLIQGALSSYVHAIDEGIAPEQARMILPQSMLTEYWVTGSLYAWANAYIQRSDSHAQKEIQELAKQWDEIIRPLYPVSWSALVD